ncbi:hypothetical protein LJC45_02385 [Alistipes sp. OttesenSCG-928-B03]|nr:hypothetical protein [Alistipes sp. OttesenSCG-928-B03]
MKKFFLWALVALVSVGFVACDNDDDDYPRYYSYVTVEKHENRELTFRKDGGGRLYVDETYADVGRLVEGDRLIVYYDTDDLVKAESATESASYEIDLYGGRMVLTKNPVLESKMDDEKEQEIGDDPIFVRGAWYGGEYLNIRFATYYMPYGKSHFINLVAEDVEYDGTELIVNLRHNGYDELPGPGSSTLLSVGHSIVSFNLVNMLDEMGEDEFPAKIKLVWKEYKNNSSSETEIKTKELGKFVPWSVEEKATKADYDTDEIVWE